MPLLMLSRPSKINDYSDERSVKMVKESKDLLAEPLAKLFNESIREVFLIVWS